MTQFYLQQGHGMMGLNREFLESNIGTGVILSPRNCTREQIEKHASEIHQKKGKVLFDPQFYEPRTSLEKILDYPYWGGMDFNTVEFSDKGASELCRGVIEFQKNILNVDKVILPGRYTNTASEDWLQMQYTFADSAQKLQVNKPILSTIALGPDVILDKDMLDKTVNEIISYPVEGVYIVLKHPKNQYLVTNDLYIYNLLNSLLSISLSGKEVILGYTNQQHLFYAGAGVSGIASGNFRNVRSFDPDNFDTQDSKVIQRATWYYDADTLSEFRSETIALAYRRGLKGSFGPICEYCRPLLEADNPVNVPWGEPSAFRHYLTEINRQWLEFSKIPFSERLDVSIELLENSSAKLEVMVESGLRLGERSFIDVVDPTLNALTAFKADRKEEIALLGSFIAEV
ncbi:hypothetical protein [Peribacillus sp. Hz7]|uniref:hypothetical protein n=1 Tax=Peribacillus sp. Hz7 TaxID=3344873 RepID=UPI0035C9AB42